MRLANLEAVKNTAEELLQQTGMDDEAAKDLALKVNDLIQLYEKIKEDTQNRNQVLEHTLGVSDKFWDDLNGLVGTFKDLTETLSTQEGPSLQPRSIREQQEALDVSTVHRPIQC